MGQFSELRSKFNSHLENIRFNTKQFRKRFDKTSLRQKKEVMKVKRLKIPKSKRSGSKYIHDVKEHYKHV